MSFTIFQNEKTPFQAIKTRSSKSRRIDIFRKGLTHAIGPKMAIQAPFLFFTQYRVGKCLLRYFRTRKRLSRLEKKEIQIVEKLTFFPNGLTHRFGPKMAVLATFFFMQYRPGKCLLRYSTRKKRLFQAIKTRNSKSRKIDNFPKGLTHGFGPKMAILATFLFFTQYRVGKCLLGYSRTKKRLFQAMKTRTLKSRKIDIFPKGLIHGFGQKMAILPTFF